MLLQVIHTHTPEQCPGNDENKLNIFNKAVHDAKQNGVIIRSYLINAPAHKIFFVLETNEFENVHLMFKDSMAFGSYEFIPVIDPDAERRYVHKEILEGLRGQKQNE